MVVNVDHLCPVCLGIGPCALCADSGTVRAPADQSIGVDLSPQWLESQGASWLLSSDIEKEVAMDWAFEAGYKAGRKSK